MAGRCGTEAAPFEFHEEVEVHLGDYPEVWLVHGVLALWIFRCENAFSAEKIHVLPENASLINRLRCGSTRSHEKFIKILEVAQTMITRAREETDERAREIAPMQAELAQCKANCAALMR